MQTYLFTVGISVLLAKCAEHYGKYDRDKIQLNSFFVFLLIAFLVCVSGFRNEYVLYSDEWNYRYSFDQMIGQSFDRSLLFDSEAGFYVLNWILAQTFQDSQSLIFFTSLIINLLIIKTIAKESKNFTSSVFIYISAGYFLTSMNVIRQYIAVAIIFSSYPMLNEGRNIRFIICVLIASLFHSSSLVVLPATIFLKYAKSNLSKFLVLVFLLYAMFNFEGIISTVIGGTKYDTYIDDLYSDNSYGVGLMRTLFWLVPYIFILINQKRFLRKNILNNFDINVIILSVSIILLATNYVFFSRINEYFGIFSVITFPRINEIFVKSNRFTIKYGVLMLFFIFGFYQYWLVM